MYKKNIADICYLHAAISERAESGDKISDTIIPKLYLISKCFAEITPKKKPAARFIVIFLDNILEFYGTLQNICQKRKLLFVSSFCENTIAAYSFFMTLSCGFMIKYGDNSGNGNRQDKRSARRFKKVCAIAAASCRQNEEFPTEIASFSAPHPAKENRSAGYSRGAVRPLRYAPNA